MSHKLLFSKSFITLLTVVLMISTPFQVKAQNFKKTFKIAVTQIVQHPSLDKIRKGVIDELARQGFQEGKNLEILFQDAQGNVATAAQIAKMFVDNKPDVIVAISTPSTQAILNALKKIKIPLVYGGVTDPVGAKIIPSLSKPSPHVTGTIDLPPVEKQVELIRIMLPKAKNIGVMYNPGEANNVFQFKLINKALNSSGMRLIESQVANISEIPTATQSILKSVDAILILNSNTIISGLESVIRLTMEAKIPVFSSDPDSIVRGAIGAVANDQYEVGIQTGKMVADILRGTSPMDIPSQKVSGAKIYQNKKIMKKLGLM